MDRRLLLLLLLRTKPERAGRRDVEVLGCTKAATGWNVATASRRLPLLQRIENLIMAKNWDKDKMLPVSVDYLLFVLLLLVLFCCDSDDMLDKGTASSVADGLFLTGRSRSRKGNVMGDLFYCRYDVSLAVVACCFCYIRSAERSRLSFYRPIPLCQGTGTVRYSSFRHPGVLATPVSINEQWAARARGRGNKFLTVVSP